MEIEDRIKAAILRITSGQGSMRILAEETDPDLVLADCLTEITRLRTAPEGYVLVPTEATKEMQAAMRKHGHSAAAMWKAALAARPDVP